MKNPNECFGQPNVCMYMYILTFLCVCVYIYKQLEREIWMLMSSKEYLYRNVQNNTWENIWTLWLRKVDA